MIHKRTFNLEEVNNYKTFIEDLRNTARDPNQDCDGRPVLPAPPTNPQDVDYIDIELIADRNVTVRIRRHDLYLIGYQGVNGTWYEVSSGTHLISGSVSLGFSGSYHELGMIQRVGYHTLNAAINNLAYTTNYDERRRSMGALAVMISESARFERLSVVFAKQVQAYTDINFDPWMELLIHSWGDLSARLLRQDTSGDLLPQYEGNENPLTTVVGLRTRDDVVACLGLLRGACSRDGRHGRSVPTTDIGTCEGMGQPLVEIFSVCINNIDNDNPGKLYGTVQVTDGLDSFYLYNRTHDDHESICPNDVASLTGPYRSISLCQFFTVTLNLKNHHSIFNRHDEVSNGSFSWDIFSLYTKSYYDERLVQPVTGTHGSASVYYSMFRDAVQANIDVVLIDGDKEDPACVYGTLVARYDNYDYSTPEQKKYYQTVLFNKSSSDNVKVRPGYSIPLSRYVVAVPTTSSLVIEADLWDHDTLFLNPDDEIAKGFTGPLGPQTASESTYVIKGRYGSVHVIVTWSPISK